MTHAYGVEKTVGRSTRLDRVLAELVAQVPEIEAASVVSFDGLPMAAALPPGMDEDRVAAMSAALLSLGERAAEGLGRGELSQVYVEGENGTVFLISADDEGVLVAVAAKGAKVGLMLFEVRRAAEAVAAVLRVEPLLSAVEDVAEVVEMAPVVARVADEAPSFYEPAYDDTDYPHAGYDELGPLPEPVLQAVPERAYQPVVEAFERLPSPRSTEPAISPSSTTWYAAETILPGAGSGVTDPANWG